MALSRLRILAPVVDDLTPEDFAQLQQVAQRLVAERSQNVFRQGAPSVFGTCLDVFLKNAGCSGSGSTH